MRCPSLLVLMQKVSQGVPSGRGCAPSHPNFLSCPQYKAAVPTRLTRSKYALIFIVGEKAYPTLWLLDPTDLPYRVVCTSLPLTYSHRKGVTEDSQIAVHCCICTSIGEHVTICNHNGWGDIGKKKMTKLTFHQCRCCVCVGMVEGRFWSSTSEKWWSIRSPRVCRFASVAVKWRPSRTALSVICAHFLASAKRAKVAVRGGAPWRRTFTRYVPLRRSIIAIVGSPQVWRDTSKTRKGKWSVPRVSQKALCEPKTLSKSLIFQFCRGGGMVDTTDLKSELRGIGQALKTLPIP